MKGRTWKARQLDGISLVKEFILKLGGAEDEELKGSAELWRVRYAGSVFTAYRSGSLYCNGGDAPELAFLYARISELLSQKLDVPEREILIGLDETGKGEVLGHSALAAVRITSDLVPAMDKVLGSVDTKTRKKFEFWDRIIKELDGLRGRNFSYEVETIPPWDVDRYNINKIQDVVYQRLLGRLLRGSSPDSFRIIIDDYGIGKNLGQFLEALHRAGAEIRVEARADEHYVEVRAAAIVSKWRRELAMKRINERFSLENAPVGSGNAGDPLTKTWLALWKATGRPWPWFVKTSYSTIRELDGHVGPGHYTPILLRVSCARFQRNSDRSGEQRPG